jgi:hypothetical protein
VAQNFLNFLCRYFESFVVLLIRADVLVTVDAIVVADDDNGLDDNDDDVDVINWSLLVAFTKFTLIPFVRLRLAGIDFELLK